MGRRTWGTSSGRDRAEIILWDLDLRARAWEALERILCFCWLINSRHWALRWVWSVPLGRARRDEDGWITNSLAAWIWDRETALNIRIWRHADRCEIGRYSITQEQVAVLAGDQDTEETA